MCAYYTPRAGGAFPDLPDLPDLPEFAEFVK